jgi:hypothetical protein
LSAVGFFVLLLAQAQTIPWNGDSPSKKGDLHGGELVIRGEAGQSRLLITLRDPKLPSNRFVLKTSASGRLTGTAILEMVLLRHPDDEVAERFVRTVDTGGPMAKLSGEFQDREIELPCVSDPENPPSVIRVSVRFEDGGEIRIRPFTIEPWQRGSLTWMAAGGAAMILGLSLGSLGGIYSIMAAIPAFRLAAYRMGGALTLVGLAMVVSAVLLYRFGSPFGIWMTLAVGGGICVVAFGGTMLLLKSALLNDRNRRRDPEAGVEAS